MRRVPITLIAAWTLATNSCGKPAEKPSATIELSEFVTLGVPMGASDLQGTAPARAVSGAFAAMVHSGRGGGIAVFNSAGGFLRELGAQGRGPGEFSDLVSVGFGPGDTLWAVEPTRAQAFSPAPELGYVRSVDFGTATMSSVTAMGFLSRGIVTQSGLQKPTLRDWTGAVTATFPAPSDVTKMEAGMGPVGLTDSGALWFGNGERYELALINRDGSVGMRIERDVAWFPPDEPYKGLLNVERPPARLAVIASDDAGRVLVVSRRAHRNWKPMENARPTTSEPVAARAQGSPLKLSELFETVLEVFGPDGKLLATRDLADGMQGLVDGSYLYQFLEDEAGHVSVRLWKIRVVEEP